MKATTELKATPTPTRAAATATNITAPTVPGWGVGCVGGAALGGRAQAQQGRTVVWVAAGGLAGWHCNGVFRSPAPPMMSPVELESSVETLEAQASVKPLSVQLQTYCGRRDES